MPAPLGFFRHSDSFTIRIGSNFAPQYVKNRATHPVVIGILYVYKLAQELMPRRITIQ